MIERGKCYFRLSLIASFIVTAAFFTDPSKGSTSAAIFLYMSGSFEFEMLAKLFCTSTIGHRTENEC